MLTIDSVRRLRLSRRPKGQMFVARAILAHNYGFLPGVKIHFEGAENLPPAPVLFAMNHTDRYNYWPFQYALYRRYGRFTAAWVKGKYFEGAAMAAFMRSMNTIPTISRGHVITKDFVGTCGRRPTDEEYRALRDAVNAAFKGEDDLPLDGLPPELLKSDRNILGRRFDPSAESYAAAINGVFAEMMQAFVQLNGQCLHDGIDLMIFPEGTRSVRLGKGRIGLAQIALRYRATIVPVGCNGSDVVYPGNSPWAAKGDITYRIGAPLSRQDVDPFAIDDDYEPFSREAETKYGAQFQGLTDLLMTRIEALLDDRHLPAADAQSVVSGSDRFV